MRVTTRTTTRAMPATAATRAAIVLVLATLAAACGDDATGGSTTGPDVPVVVATTSIWADVAANVACDGLAEVRTIIPVGGDPHSFEPSLRDRDELERAALVVANGLALEETLEDTIDAAVDSGTPVFRFADEMTPLAADDHDVDVDDEHADYGDHAEDAADEDADEHAHAGGDPHVWFDPTRVAAALPALRDALVEHAGLDAERVDGCVETYRTAIAAADADVAARLAAIPPDRRTLVTNHEALGYFAEQYGFEVLGAVIPSPSTLAETSTADLQELTAIVEEAGVPAIFAEAQHSSVEADALAESIGGIEVVTLFTDSLGPPGSGADTYLGLLATDAQLIADALS